MPFANFGGDPEQSFLVDSVTTDIVTELSRFRQLRIAAGSTMAEQDLVSFRYRLDGSVRRAGGSIRITAQLKDTATGHSVWAEKYDRQEDQIFSIQDELVRTIVTTLAGRIMADQVEEVRRKPPTMLAAYECVLMADAMNFRDPEANARAQSLCKQALSLDPAYARAVTLLGWLEFRRWSDFPTSPDSLIDSAVQYADKALALDETDSNCHHLLGAIHLWRYHYDQSAFHHKRALALNPNRPSLICGLGDLALFEGNITEAARLYRSAKEVDPFFNPDWYWSTMGIIRYQAKDYRGALDDFARVPDQRDWVKAFQAACHARLGESGPAHHFATQVLQLNPGFTIGNCLLHDPYRHESDRRHLEDGMKLAGLPE